MKRYKRFKEMDDKVIISKIAGKVYEINLTDMKEQYANLFGKDLWNIEKVFGKQLKRKGNSSYQGKIDISIEGLMATAYQLKGDKIFKNLNELINTIFGKVEGSFDYWVDLPDEISFKDAIIDIDFTYLYNDTLDITIDILE